MKSKIILHIPHNTKTEDKALIDSWCKNEDDYVEFKKITDNFTDWFTNPLFVPSFTKFNKSDFSIHAFQKSRFDIDVERLVNDPLEKIGQGILYTNYGNVSRSLTKEEIDSKMKEYFTFNEELKNAIISSDKMGVRPVVIDCHSFPSFLYKDTGFPDICLGYDEDVSKPSRVIIDKIKTLFENYGYSVDENTPYSNSIQPVSEKEWSFSTPYISFMLEINKAIYMDEDKLELAEVSVKFKDALSKLYEMILRCDI